MKHLIKSGALAFAIVVSLGLTTGEVRAGEINGSQASVLVTGSSVVMVVSGPIFLSAAGVRGAADMSRESRERREEKRRISAGPLPDLEVKSIETAADGGRRVTLEDPANAENRATLQWPKREDDPAAGFTVGAKIAFQPSPQGAGWMLRNPEGAALAFVPTIEAVDESRTRTL
ncbi:hypothetical protein [uncultured Stenotrophomonas sp.]|uniref:hypothetical protein n=1 Tax=uncultured Stenotrophomonas sp. TaxID=165438 RepID=UPI0025E1506F|nr:hypothetical protein [uncultured Stenotrophomonas sp.]